MKLKTLDYVHAHQLTRRPFNVYVPVIDGDLVRALKTFKREVNDGGVLASMKRHHYYLSPTVRRRRKSRLVRAKKHRANMRRDRTEAA